MERGALIAANSVAFGKLTEIFGSYWDTPNRTCDVPSIIIFVDVICTTALVWGLPQRDGRA
jgi:hypothetical protein